MSLRVRLSLLFLAVSLLAVLATGTALHALNRLDDLLVAERDQFQRELAVRDLEGTLREAGTEVTAFLAGEGSARSGYEARIADANSQIERILTTTKDLDEAARLEALQGELSRYRTAVDRAFYLAKKGQDDRAFRTFRKWIDARMQPAFREQLHELVVSYRQQSLDAASRARVSGTTARATVLICFVALAAVTVSCVFLLRRWIVAPLRTLTTATQAVAEGRYRQSVPIHTRDEIGALARDVEAMSSSIADFQKELVDRERYAAVGEMTATVAHNIRNPLASIRVLAQSLQRRGDSADPDLDRSLREIMATVDRADRWLRDLLVELRPVRVERAPEDLGELLAEVGDALREHAERGSVAIETDIEPSLPLVPCDRRKLSQAFVSLLSNAIEAAPEGTSVVVRSRRPTIATDHVEVVVEDRGPGIDIEAQRRLFSPSYTTKPNGTGLGLSLVQRIVFGHEGRITVDSSPGDGCRMHVFLPIAANGLPAKEGE